jgi:sugar phosphate isomerase/epimerase
MSRSGYSDDCECIELYRQAVDAAILGRRGQALLKRLRDALDAMPVKRLISGQIKDAAGEVCAFGALDPAAPNGDDEDESADLLARHFGIARALAAEVVYINDEYWTARRETPEDKWVRMRAWVEKNIGPDLDASEEP